jgi:hypothetical protein
VEFEETGNSAETYKTFVNWLTYNFRGASLKEITNAQRIYKFNIPAIEGHTWARIFGWFEETKNRLNVKDYSVAQTTLEEVFTFLANVTAADPDDEEDAEEYIPHQVAKTDAEIASNSHKEGVPESFGHQVYTQEGSKSL